MASKVGHENRITLLPTAGGVSSLKKSSIPRVFKALVLLSVAATLSTFLPLPWSILRVSTSSNVPLRVASSDPASEWKDDVWPIRPQTPWDISTDFPYPRSLEYDVSEGTWLRLDVHPKSGDIIFDMVGDLYCLPGREAYHGQSRVTRARPVLLGVPYDSDPHFSPEGDRIVFRSDAGLGVENIWVTKWEGCEAMDIRPVEGSMSRDLERALGLKKVEEGLLAKGLKETEERKLNRLIREGRQGCTFNHLTLSCMPLAYPSKPSVLRMRHTGGSATPASTRRVPKSLQRNGTRQAVRLVLEKPGSMLSPLLMLERAPSNPGVGAVY